MLSTLENRLLGSQHGLKNLMLDARLRLKFTQAAQTPAVQSCRQTEPSIPGRRISRASYRVSFPLTRCQHRLPKTKEPISQGV